MSESAKQGARSLLSNLRDAVLMTVIEWCVRGLSTEARAGLRHSVKSGGRHV